MRRSPKFLSKLTNQLQANQVSGRMRARKLAKDLFNEISPLEERVLLTTTITSSTDLSQYFSSGKFSVTDQSEIIIDSNVSIITNGGSIYLAAPCITMNSNVSLTSVGGDITIDGTALWKSNDKTKDVVHPNNQGITLGQNVVINASSSSGQAGAIELTSTAVSIGANSTIQASGSTHEQDGAITIAAENMMRGFNISALTQAEDIIRLFQNQSATISVGQGTTIEGGAVNLSTESGNELKASWVSNLIIQPFSAILLEAFHKPDLLTLPVTVQVWQPQSTISFAAGSNIASSGTVTVTSNATVNAVGKAIWNTLNYGTHFGKDHFFDGDSSPTADISGRLGLALGDFYTDANATITLGSNATIQAAGEVEMKTTVDNVVELESEAIKNLGITQTNPNAISLAFGFTQLKTTSVIDLQKDSLIEAEGSVNIEAEATDENAVSGLATAYRDGTVSAGGAFAYSHANVQVFVNGTVTSGVEPAQHEDLAPVLFNPSFSANFTNSSLNFLSPVQYTTGQALVFDSADGSTIPGLKPGSAYYAIVNAAFPNRLQLAASKDDAINGTPISFGIGYPTLTAGANTLPISVIDSAVSNAILFGYATLPDGSPVLTNGQTVNYNPLAGQFIGTSDSSGNYTGPLAAGQYTVKIVPSPEPDYFPMAIQLYDSNNNLLILNTYSQFVTSDGTAYQVSSFDTSTSQVDFNFTQPPVSDNGPVLLPVPNQNVSLSNGQAISFVSGLDCQIGNLVDGQTYYAVVDPATPGVIRLATTYAQSLAANPAVQDAIPQLKTVSNQLAISSTIAESFTNSSQTSTLQPQNNNSYTLYNNATGGTFQLTVNGPEGSETTPALPYNATATALQTALNAISGIVATVTGAGNQASPWQIAILFQFNIGNIQPGMGLVFSNNPNLADGTAVQYLGVEGKPVGGLTNGATYYAYNTTNPDFDPNFAQYVLNLKTTFSATAPDIDLVLQQSMTDANGLNYNFVAANAAENQVILQLSQTVAVSSVNNSGLTAGQVSFQALPTGGVQFYSLATSGTFTFSVTDSSGIVQTTGNIAFNASPSVVAAALNSLSGVSVQVTGLGTISSPWTIVGLSDQSIATDSSNLKNDGFASNMLSRDLGDGIQQVWTNATGGTFTISLNQNGQILTTAPIASNATADDFENAINALPRIKALVSGSGTASDPWQFTAVYQSIVTGDALTFNDCWNSYNNGMINGQQYYAVVSADQYDPQALLISLAASYADAVASTPVLINMQDYLLLQANHTGVMTGSQMGLQQVNSEEAGVTIKAVLEASDSVSFTSNVGLFPMLAYYTAGATAGHHSYKNEDGGYLSAIEKHIEENLPDELAQGWLNMESGKKLQYDYLTGKKIDVTHPLQTSFAFALLVSKNNVNVNIGSTAVIETAGVVTIVSEINHVLHTQADAGVARTTMSKTDGGEARTNAALAVGLNLAFVDNTSLAVVQSNSEVTGGEGVVIDSAISYPFAWKETNISALKNANGSLSKKQKAVDGTALAENIVKDALFKNAFGVSNWLFNHSVNTDVMQPDNSVLDWTLSASVSSINIKNTNLAQICDGAQINQSHNVLAGANQSVSVTADTDISQVSITGQMVLGLNFGWLFYANKAKGGFTENYNYMLFLNQGKNAIGGSINVTGMDNSTQALIGGENPSVFANMPENQSQSPAGPTELNFGNSGLTVEAATNNEFISIAQSGGIASGFGFQASIAVTAVGTQNTTSAVMATTNPPVIQNNPGTNGNITIESIDSTVLTPSSGGLLVGKSINLGFSSSEATLNRNVSAYIGQSSPDAAANKSAWVNIHSAGEIVIDACATGKILPVSLAGSVVTKPSDANGVETEFNDTEFRWGIGVSGDYSEANIVDNVSAYLNGVNLFGHENEQLLEIAGLNNTSLNIATGAAALQFEGSQRSSVGFAGSASYCNYLSNVNVLINQANISEFSISLDARNNKTVGTFAAGLSGSNVGKIGVDVAGSLAINHVTNDTVAEIANSTGSQLGSVEIAAVETEDIWAAAGTITFVTSFGKGVGNPESVKTKVGFGFGFAQNLLSSTTHSIISDSELEQTTGELSIEAEQASRSFVLSAGLVFEAGKGTGITPYGMVALNQYNTADVQAVVENSQLISSSTGHAAGFVIASQLIPVMITAAGDLGLSLSDKTGVGSAVSLGAGVSVTEVSITGNSIASVNNSNITLDQGNLEVSAYTGQAANATYLTNTLNNLNLPPGNYNLYSLAIAGGLTTAIAPAGELAVGVDGVGAGIGSTTSINTLANVTNGSNITLLAQGGNGGELTVNSLENLSVYDDAGGASVSIQYSPSASFGVAVGIGAGVHNSTNNAIASVIDSVVQTADNMTVSADISSSVTVIGFGVALDLSVADGVGGGASASSATGKITSTNTISAYITGGNITSGASIDLMATDSSHLQSGVGSGSLAVGTGSGIGVALAAGSSISRIEPSHTISAYIGSTSANPETPTNVTADGPIVIQATNNQQISAQTIAVASSIAVGEAASIGVAATGAGARVTTNNNITSGILYGANVESHAGSGQSAIAVQAVDHANLVSTVGSAALNVSISANPYAMIGGSLGISISEITNNDNAKALVQGATITTSGGDVLVQALGNNTHFSESVATSLSISLISIAGAGGNSNIYDNANITASVDSGSSIVTGNSTTSYGSLSVLANTSENVMAQMFGGAGSVGAVGVFMSNATRSGSTVANLTTNGTISVSNLVVKATTNQTITSEGMSVTVGGLAGTGETHRLYIDETVQTNVNGSGKTWNVSGNLSIGASSTNHATAKTSGAGDDQQDVSVALLGVGFFKVYSAVNPVVSTSISEVKLNVSGSSSMGSIAVSDNNTEARSGSGSAVGGDAARAITDNSPKISFATSNLILSAGSATFLAQNCGTYTTNADSVYATALGGSAARAFNTSSPNLTLNLGSGTAIKVNGSVIVKAQNDMTGLGDASNMNGKTGGIMARVGGGGIVSGFGGTSESCLTACSALSLGNGVSISTNSRNGNILIGSSQGWNTNQLTYIHDMNYFAGGASVSSTVTSCLTNNIALGSNVTLSAPGGMVGIGTNINSQTIADSYSQTFSTIGGSSSNSDNTLESCQTVTIGANSVLKAAGSIAVMAGSNPVNSSGTLQDTFALVTAHDKGVISIPGTTASSTSNSKLNVSLGSGSQIISDRDVNLGAQPGINSAQWYTFANIDGAKGKTHCGTTGATQTSCVTINGNVIAGNTHQLAINIPESGTTATVNGQAVNLANIGSCLTNINPQPNSAFLPFQASYNSNYNATQLLNGLDPTSKAILENSISSTPVKSITLANLAATGGQVVIYANSTLDGAGTVSAFSPNITVNNNSPAYLLLDGIGIPNTLDMGKITVVGNVGVPAGMTLNQQPAKPSITINENYTSVVGTGTTSGPAIAITGPIVNTGGSVSIFNACGALVQDAPINAAAVSISTPNSAYIVNTPKNYMGTGGSIADYWMNTSTNLVQNSGFESPSLGSGSSAYQYNPTGVNWTFTGDAGISGNKSGFTSGNANAPAGGQVAFLQEKGVMSQTISGLVPGQQYSLSFFAAQRSGYPNQSFSVTIGNQILVSSLTPNSTSYQQYSYTFTPTTSGNLTLTLTGLEPSGTGVDETVFIDQVNISPSPAVVTPGLNSYVYQYTANLAATTAANILYLEQSEATNSSNFSSWLYNTGMNGGNNGIGVGGADFVNTNVSAGNPGSYYPSKAGNNWGTTEYGTGVIFFGSEIPYLYVNGSATIPNGSSYLTSGLGYLDTLANAQYWSVAASGNPADNYLNVTQGTGPQNDDVNPGRGIYPVVPSTFPTNATISNPQNVTLGNGITAGQLDITALYIDINSPINLGVKNTGFQANLSSSLGSYIQSQVAGNASLSCLPIPDNYLGGSNTSLTAYYDVLANQIVLNPVAINAGVVSAIFKGGIISTTNQGKISVTSNPGQNLIDNQSGYPLVVQSITAAESKLAGIVQFNDTLTNLSTAYVYRGNTQVDKYQGPLGPMHGANLSQLKLVSTNSGTSASFSPAANLAYQWDQQAYISRNLSFTNNNNAYTLNGSTVNDNWSWGPLATNGSAPTDYTSSTNPFKLAAVPVNLVKSGGFETPANTTGAPENYQYNPSGSDWSFIGNSGLSGNGSGFTSTNPNAPQGKQVAFVQMTGSISQTVSGLVAGTKYNLTFVAAQRNGYYSSSQYQTLNITLGDQTVASNVKPDSIYYNQYSYSFTCNTSGSQVLTFTGLKPTNQDETVFLDAVVLSANLPVSSSSQGQVVNLTGPITNYTQQISALMTQSETATTFFSSNYQDAWNFGPSTQWTWMYPTEILMTIKNLLPACNSIAIDFSGVQYGSLGINSGSNLMLNDNILFPGSVSLNSGGSITQVSGAVIAANKLTGLTAGGAIGNATSPLNLGIASGTINAQANTGLYLTSGPNLTIGQVSAANGPVQIQSAGLIFASGTSTNVSGTDITLQAINNSIGSQAQPLAIQTKTTTLPTGSVTGGLFTASAYSSIFVTQATGDLRIASVTTTSPVGVVSINALSGNITDGNIPDAFGLNNSSLSPALVGQVIDSMRLNGQNNVNTTIAAFEGSVDSSYLQYWTTLQNGSVADGNLTLTANGVQYYQPSANLYYANTANQTSNATVAQVNSYANMLYDNAINVFENNLAYGPGWASLPQFQAYNANYTYIASNATVSALSYQALNIGNDFALLSLDALSPQGSALLGNTTAPAIQTTVLDLKAGGSIGLTLDPVEIDLDSIQSGNLTIKERVLLALASEAGELQMVGTSNATGQKVYYSYGSEPANITATGVVVRIEKPLFVNVAESGLAMLQANGSINISDTQGNFNLLGATSGKDIRLTSQSGITQGQLQPSTTTPGWSLGTGGTLGYSGNGWNWSASGLSLSANVISNITADGNLRLVSGGDIGTPATPLEIQVGKALSVYASGSLALNQPTGDLLLSDVQVGPLGAVAINAGGNISNTINIFKGTFNGFGGNGTGWTTNSKANGSASISDNVLTLGQSQPPVGGISSASAMYGTPVTIGNSFITSFVYQSQTTGSTTYFFIKNADEPDVVTNQIDINPGGPAFVCLQINSPSASAGVQTVGLIYNAALRDVQVPGGINFASGDPIQVVITYDNTENSITVALTDTVTQQSYSFVSNNINLLRLMASTQGQLGFYSTGNGQPASQSISGFSYAYGSPTIQGQSVSLTSGGAIGAATNPILTLVSGNISATAPDGVYLLETSGNMYVQTVASTGNVSLAAPTGSVVGTSGGTVQASGGIHAAARPRAMGIIADQLTIQSLVAIGSVDQPLTIRASGISASTLLGDIRLNPLGSLAVSSPVRAGGAVEIKGDSNIGISANVMASGPISIETLPGFGGPSRVNIASGGSVVSTGNRVDILGGDGVTIATGARVESHGSGDLSHIRLASLTQVSTSAQAFDVEVHGHLVADTINLQTQADRSRLYLDLTGTNGHSLIPTVQVDAWSGNGTLTLDSRGNHLGQAVTIAENAIQTGNQKILLNAIDSVILELGNGNDQVKVGANLPLDQLQIFTGGGDDSVETTLATSSTVHQIIDGGTGSDSVQIDAAGQNAWASSGLLQSWDLTIKHNATEMVSIKSATTLNAMPAMNFVTPPAVTDPGTSNRQFIDSAYSQVLGRPATANELDRWAGMLGRHTITRLQLATKLTTTDEARLLRVNAWYLNYFGRPASQLESKQALRRMRSGQSETRILAGILSAEEFFDRTQTIAKTGHSADRFITSLYKLAIDPSGRPTPALSRFLGRIYQTRGRTAVVMNVLQSAPVAQNQAEALSILINQAPANRAIPQIRLGQSRPTGVQATLLSRK